MNDRVLPTPEQQRHAKYDWAHTRDAERVNKAGEVDLVNVHECQLDKLRDTDRLGGGLRAEDRYKAGMWLRQLYISTHNLSEGVADYDGLGHDQSEMTEAQAWNHKTFLDIKGMLSGHWKPLERVCCFDLEWTLNLEILWNALDMLHEYRYGSQPGRARIRAYRKS